MLVARPKLPEDFGEPASETDFEKRWKLVEMDYGEGVGGPEGLEELPDEVKWQIVCMVECQRSEKQQMDEDEAEGEAEGGRFGVMLRDDDDLRHFMHSPTR